MRKDSKATSASSTDARFAPILDAFAGQRGVTQGRMFGAPGLKVGGEETVRGPNTAEVVAFLASDQASSLTGAIVNASCGEVLD